MPWRNLLLIALLSLAAVLIPLPLRAEPALKPLPIRGVRIEDDFWSPRLKVWREVTIPDCFAKFEKDGALANFDKIRDGVGGEHGGPPWYDGLIYEMIRGCADFLADRRDPVLEARLDGYIERIAAAAAKDPDGYLNTYTQLKEPNHRWGLNGGNDNWQHDVYNAGAMIEAGVHYYRATGKIRLLQVATRLANHMADVMGPAPKKNVVPGHSLGEEALVKLHCLFREQPQLKSRMSSPVDENRYLKLAEFWIENRGNHQGRKSYDAYGQDHKPVLQQETIEGHAVRATLLCTGLVAAANVNGREDYLTAARRLWENMVQRRMYVIGGLGAVAGHEGFGPDYALPNDGYLETCAAIGAGFFHHNMNLAFADARYADELERVLYNAILPGVSLRGDSYFYENPLEATPKRTRWAWHGCPCCPPMFLKIMGALPGYIYATKPDGVFVNLYIGSRASTSIGATALSLRQTTSYPWQGAARIAVQPAAPAEFDLNLRVPAWCQGVAKPDDLYATAGRPESGAFIARVNGQPLSAPIVAGYARIHRRWQPNDVVEVEMQMPVRRIQANPLVKTDAGRVALQRGPLVYCAESIDNQGRVRNLSLPDDARLSAEFRPDLLGGITVVRGEAMASFVETPTPKPAPFLAIPYYANANRGPVAMCVWLPRSAADAIPASITGEATIRIDASQSGRPVSRYLAGACIEDVNHEIFGGIYSQMIFGESFQEPPRAAPIKGFVVADGEWRVADGQLRGEAGAGPKLVNTSIAPFAAGEAGVDVFLPGNESGNAGLVLCVNKAGPGADNFDGYEVAIDAARKRLVLGRHQHDFRLMKEVPCEVAADRWIALAAKVTDRTIEVFIDGKSVARVEDGRPLPAGAVGLRQWQRPARYRNFWVKPADRHIDIPFETPSGAPSALSAMWGPIATGDALLETIIEKDRPFAGAQSQRITLARGAGEVGIENQGLNRWGMAFVAGKPYEGYVWLRSERPIDVYVRLESRDGSRAYAETQVAVVGDEWRRYDFTLTPDRSEPAGRFALRLKSPGSVVIGHAFLQPGPWGRFKNLPLRRDVVEALIDQGITVLRYGGSMINAPEYRWKKMIGPRDRRPPYKGTWYPYSTNGWGILDFLDLCETAGFLAIPDFNIDETPQDMADFVEYVNGPADSEWGRRRVADGHPAPYKLRHIQLGNEERVDEAYYQKFQRLAKAIWAKDPQVILVVGDFAYDRPIADPMNFEGAASGIRNLAAQKKILALAREAGREVWFDVHLWTEGPGRSPSSRAFKSFVDAIDRLAEEARHRVVVFEFNANNHDHRRALANADMIGEIIRDGRIPVALSANCLQPDRQNDNGWNQGLLFLNPSKVWLQPPGFVTRMVSRTCQPRAIDARVDGADQQVSVTAMRSEDGRRLVLQVVNLDSKPWPARIQFHGFTPAQPTATVEELSGPLDAANTADAATRIQPRQTQWRHQIRDGVASFVFAPRSFTVLQLD